MSLQNRVTPLGDIVATAERGGFTGNRGIIHDAQTQTLLRRRWASRAWLVCTLEFRGAQRKVMGPGSWTELFFVDEATALAAGHRPCFLCRRPEALAFQMRFPRAAQAHPKAGEIDHVLHAERLDSRSKRLHALPAPAAELPDGTMVLQHGAPHLVLDGAARRWSHAGYGSPIPIMDSAALITPPSTVAALKAGYRPTLHASALSGHMQSTPAARA